MTWIDWIAIFLLLCGVTLGLAISVDRLLYKLGLWKACYKTLIFFADILFKENDDDHNSARSLIWCVVAFPLTAGIYKFIIHLFNR